MTVDEALQYADEWAKGQTFYEGMQGWRVVCATLADEVHRLRDEKADSIRRIECLRVNADDDYAAGFHRAVVESLEILRGEQ